MSLIGMALSVIWVVFFLGGNTKTGETPLGVGLQLMVAAKVGNNVSRK